MKTYYKATFILLAIFFIVCKRSYAQSPGWNWVKGVGSGGGESCRSVAIDPASGDMYTTGLYSGTVDFDPGNDTFNLTGGGMFISKLDSSGNFLWAKAITGTSYIFSFSITLDTSGSGAIYTTGWFQGTSDFDPGSGTFYLTSPEYYDWTICSDPDCPWYPNSCFCPCYISGYSVAMFISKLDSSGNFLWAKVIGASEDESSAIGYSIVVDTEGSGGVYVAGNFEGMVDFDPGAGTFNLTTALDSTLCVDWCLNSYYVCNKYLFGKFISKLDADGNFLWAKALSGGAEDGDRSIALDTSGNVYNTGYGAGIIYISKLNASGTLIWEKQIGGPEGGGEGYSIAVDIASGDIYTAGFFGGTVDFDPGAGTFNLTSVGISDIFIIKLDSSGNFLWARAMGGTSHDKCSSMTLETTGGAIYTTGWFQGTSDFDPGAGIFNLVSAGSSDIFVSKLDSAGNFAWAKAAGGFAWDQGTSIAVNALNKVHVVGYFASDTMMFDTTVLISGGDEDIFITQLNPCATMVTSSGDSGSGTLRDICSCSPSGATITFNADLVDQTIILTSGEILINKNLHLSGLGMLNLTLSGNNNSRIFHVLPGKNLNIENLSLKNATSLTNGGAIFVEGDLTLKNVLFDNNFQNGIPKGITVISPGGQIVIKGHTNIQY